MSSLPLLKLIVCRSIYRKQNRNWSAAITRNIPGMKFGLFFLAEYANMITSSAVITTLFFGGWSLPYIEHLGLSVFTLSILHVLTFIAKVIGIMFFFIAVRWTIPRFRYDQLMRLGWKVMLPLAIINFLLTGIGMLFLS